MSNLQDESDLRILLPIASHDLGNEIGVERHKAGRLERTVLGAFPDVSRQHTECVDGGKIERDES